MLGAGLFICKQERSLFFRRASRSFVAQGVPSAKIEVIYNWCDDSNIKASEANKEIGKKLGFNGRFNVLFAGTMGKAKAWNQ